MQVNKMVQPSGDLHVALYVFQVSVEITDAADDVGNSNFICGLLGCLLQVKRSQGEIWYSGVRLRKDMT